MGALPQDLEQTKILGMGQFDIIDGPVADDDKIVIHLGHLTQAQYDKVVESVIAFMNQRWPNLMQLGVDN